MGMTRFTLKGAAAIIEDHQKSIRKLESDVAYLRENGPGWLQDQYAALQKENDALKGLVLGTPCPKCDCPDCQREIQRYRSLEAENDALKAELTVAKKALGQRKFDGTLVISCPGPEAHKQLVARAEKAEALLSQAHDWFHIELKPRNKPDPWCWFCDKGVPLAKKEAP
jgi:hypothetical protein